MSGAAIHEIILKVSGAGPSGPIETEFAVRVPLGVPDTQPIDDGTYANFEMKEVGR